MASSEQLKALLRSHLSGDEERFLSIALQVAAHEARIGHGKLALELRDIVEKAKKQVKSSVHISIAKGLKDASGLLYATTPQVRLGDLVTTDEVRDKLIRVIREQRHLGKLKNHGLAPRRRLLLVGPPGTGKTFTASVLAGELGYPLFQVRLDALITKFMGESSAKLRQVFDAIREVRGIYFFDEFDALGTQRAAPNDVGEARRILTSFLQMIEQDDSNSVIVCATNHVQMLDYALFRRFDDVIQYKLPCQEEIVSLFKSRLKSYVGKDFPWAELATKAAGLSSAEITLAAQDAIKELLIHEHNAISAALVESAIEDRRGMSHEMHQ
jgi:SpoVK/Ycf46/Vps4 family AAA+-type ATPase